MSLSSLRKWFSFIKTKSKKSDAEESSRESIEGDRDIAKPLDLHVGWEIDKEINKVVVSGQSPDAGFDFVEKISFFEKYLTENPHLLDYVKQSFTGKQQQEYWAIVGELRHCSGELGSMLKNKDFFEKRNENVADVFGQCHPEFKSFEEKKEQVCNDVESILKKRMSHKWCVLKASKDKPFVEKFLIEIAGQKRILALRQKQMSLLLKKSAKTVADTASGKRTPIAADPVISDDRLVEEDKTSDSPLQDNGLPHGFVDENRQVCETSDLNWE